MIVSRLSKASFSSKARRIAVAMSGGVDSSVAAHLLQHDEYNNELVGLFMNNWDPSDEDEEQEMCNESDYRDAQKVCDALHIPLHYASFASEYWTHVFEPFVEGIARGDMLNPDVACNSVIKFGAMKDYARRVLGADWIATGHYARLWRRTEAVPPCLQEETDIEWLLRYGLKDSPLLLAGADATKDQSYFLSGVDNAHFHNVLFPLGEYEKGKHTRQVAAELGLATAHKRESMGICFVGKRRKFQNFIAQYLPHPHQHGSFVDVDTGQIVGTHNGDTLVRGQGAKISGSSAKYFVVERNHENNNVLVCRGTHHPALYSDTLRVRKPHWIAGAIPPPLLSHGKTMRAKCRTRHLQPLIPCSLHLKDEELTMHFDVPVRAITPGQVAAVYVGPVCLGGGPIWDRGPSYMDLDLELPPDIHPAGHNDLSVERRKL